jgi:deoxyribodipyrimidine photo-lyase
LNSDLLNRGTRLIIREGDPLIVLQKLFFENNADRIVAEADFSPYAKKRDSMVAEKLPCNFVSGLTIHPPRSVRKSDGTAYIIFTPYMHNWKSLPNPGRPLQSPDYLPGIKTLNSMDLPSASDLKYFPSSEIEAQNRLDNFLTTRLFSYYKNRNLLYLEGTSGLSPYLRLGLISARTLAFKVREVINKSNSFEDQKNGVAWLNEVIWREFYYSIMDNFPFVLKDAFRENLRYIPWRDSNNDLEAWKNGLTGYPIVDAGMRQLRETGWMHNRARMITASFLTKDLLINWQEGEQWFMEQLIDGDPASNNGGWQWSAGTGTDAAPYFRIFNPVLQGKKFDPDGSFIRCWVPELANVPKEFIHAPWEMPSDLQSRIKVQIGKTYPKPIVNHSDARKLTLSAFKISRNT